MIRGGRLEEVMRMKKTMKMKKTKKQLLRRQEKRVSEFFLKVISEAPIDGVIITATQGAQRSRMGIKSKTTTMTMT